VVLLALVAAFFWKILFLGRAIGGLDVLEYFYPYRAYAQQAIDSGRLPLWNPDHFGGAPFLANIQNAIFYPPTSLFYLLDFPTAYTWSVVLHVFLGGLFAYLFARQSLGLGRPGALLAAVAFSFGGFLGGQMGHLNQLSAAIWLPALLLCWDKASTGRLLYVLLGALVVALQFLAGHSQESYLMLVALLLYGAYGSLIGVRRRGPSVLPLNALAMAVFLALGAALAAVQLVPTLELASWSIRANGLSYQEAVTFSVKGTMLLNALLPPFANRSLLQEPGGTEFMGYISVTGLVLALVALMYARRRRAIFFVVLAALALFFALGQQNPLYPALFRLVPGFNLFRVPARWLFLYSFAAAMLAGLGTDALLTDGVKRNWRSLAAAVVLLAACGAAVARSQALPPLMTRLSWLAFGAAGLGLVGGALYLSGRGFALSAQRWRTALAGVAIAVVAGELWLAGQSLDYNHPTAPRLFDQPIGTLDFVRRQPAGFRAISVAQDTFVPAEEPAARQQLGPVLGETDLLAYLSYYKLREILEPNTSLAVGVPTIDGYDGGLLPLARYVRFKDLLTERPSAPDDRIRFVVKWLPNREMLDLAGVRYVVTDGLSDHSAGGIAYDLSSFMYAGPKRPQMTMQLAQPVRATSIATVTAIRSGSATLTLADGQGGSQSVALRLDGVEVGQLPYSEPLPTQLNSYKLDPPMVVSSIRLSGSGDAFLNGLALIDDQAGSAYSPLVAPGLELKRIYQSDVKIYENTAALAPAFLAHEAQLEPDAEHAAAAMGQEVDLARRVILEADAQPPPSRSLLGRVIGKLRRMVPNQGPPFTVPEAWLEPQPPRPGAALDRLSFDDFRPEHIVVRTDSERAGFLVLTQSLYPGWQATVDGAPARLLAADTLFQAVYLPAGQHRVEFAFRPRSLPLGEAISLAAAAVLLVGLLLARFGRRRPA